MTGKAPPNDPEGLAIHQRLVQGDIGAFADLYDRYFETLKQRFMPDIFGPDAEDVVHQLIYDALFKLRDEPARYQPERGKSLWGYLYMDVKGDVLNHIAKVRRQPQAVQFSALDGQQDDTVGDRTFAGNVIAEEPTPEESVLEDEERREVLARVGYIQENVIKTDEERIVFDLQYLKEVKATATFAEHLGLTHLSDVEQAKAVQRIKDRLDKRIKRLPKEQS